MVEGLLLDVGDLDLELFLVDPHLLGECEGEFDESELAVERFHVVCPP